jgi:alpha-ribazole phosphatase
MTTIDFIRHGEPVGGHRYRGHSIDDPLSEKGWQQMWRALETPEKWNRIISSPMLRCSEFAQALGQRLDLPVELVRDLREVGFGSWEGRSSAEIIQQNADEYDDFHMDPVRNRPPGAEDLQQFGKRVAAVYQQLLARYPGEHLLVVAHSGVIRATLGYVMQTTAAHWYRAKVNNARITRFQHTPQGNLLVFHNARLD